MITIVPGIPKRGAFNCYFGVDYAVRQRFPQGVWRVMLRIRSSEAPKSIRVAFLPNFSHDVLARGRRSAHAKCVVITFLCPNSPPPSMLHVARRGVLKKHHACAGTQVGSRTHWACPM